MQHNQVVIAAKADTVDKFPTSLLSIGQTADDGNVSIFTKEGVSVYKEEYTTTGQLATAMI